MMNSGLERAQLLYQQQRYDLAADSCRAALGEMPQDPYAHALLGLCLLHLNKYDEATAEAQSAIVMEPDFPFAHYALAGIYLERNHFPQAEAAAREAVRLDPGNPDYWGLLANALFAGQRWREALDAANTGLQYDAQHTLCINIRAMALVKLGDRQGAAASMSEALRRNPHNSLNHANQGWTMLHQNDPKQALEHFREALRLDPNNEWAREGMMQALKARHLLYRLMLRYYLWMSRFTRRGQWGIIIGLWVGVQVLRMVQDNNPGLAPFIYPLLWGYVAFVLAGWLADPIFNLTLMVNRFGRYMLALPQKIGAVAVGGLLLSTMVCLLVGYWQDNFVVFDLGLITGLLTLPVAATVRCRQRTQLVIMTCYSGLLMLMGFGSLGMQLLGLASGAHVFELFLYGCLLSSLASNIFATMIHRK